MLLCSFDPADQSGVVGKLIDHRPIGHRNVGRVARQRDPTERPFALAEKRTDVRRNESRKVERASASAQTSLRAQAVAVIEHLCAAVEKRDHRIDVRGHALAGAPDVLLRIVEPQLMRIVRREADGDIAERVMGGRLVGDDVDFEITSGEHWYDLGRIAMKADRQGAL